MKFQLSRKVLLSVDPLQEGFRIHDEVLELLASKYPNVDVLDLLEAAEDYAFDIMNGDIK